MWNGIEFEVYGEYGLFTDPLTRMGGEKKSYSVPTYDALKGIVESIYWKPSLLMRIEAVRVMNPIQMEAKGIRPIYYGGGNTLANYTYLRRPHYKVKAHFIFNPHRPDLSYDHNENKHFSILNRALKAGGRRDIFLGTRECQGYVEPTDFYAGKGFYDDTSSLSFGTMVHGFNYPDETGKEELAVRLWRPVMTKGVITFIQPEDCPLIRPLKRFTSKTFAENAMQPVDELYQDMIGDH